MEIKDVIALVRDWRIQEELPMLDNSAEVVAAEKYIKQKGFSLPGRVSSPEGTLFLKNGEYLSREQMTLTIVDWKTSDLFPWDPQDKREFWAKPLAAYVKLTGRLVANGTYYVIRSGSDNNSHEPVRGNELVLADQVDEGSHQGEFLEINRSSWAQIKTFLVDRFIKTYPWAKQGDKTSEQVREQMDILAKSAREGLAKLIEKERASDRGRFENHQNFEMRMRAAYESFPWGDFAKMLDFIV